jgi:hypothetical protein
MLVDVSLMSTIVTIMSYNAFSLPKKIILAGTIISTYEVQIL